MSAGQLLKETDATRRELTSLNHTHHLNVLQNKYIFALNYVQIVNAALAMKPVFFPKELLTVKNKKKKTHKDPKSF